MNTGNKGKHNKDLSDYGKDCFYQADMTNRGNEPYRGTGMNLKTVTSRSLKIVAGNSGCPTWIRIEKVD